MIVTVSASHDSPVWLALAGFDRLGIAPLYEQIANAIVDCILCGDLGPGEVLPSMQEVCRRLSIGYATAQHAYRVLHERKLVHSVTGGRSAVGAPDAAGNGCSDAAGDLALPRYRQIANAMILRIRSGVIGESRRLPSQPDLAREFGVSWSTAGHAVAWMRTQGWVITLAGKGTFAAPQQAWPSPEPRATENA